MGFGAPEVILILLLALLFFGGKKLPEIARGLGSSVRNFKRSMEDSDKLEGDQGPEGEEPEDREQ